MVETAEDRVPLATDADAETQPTSPGRAREFLLLAGVASLVILLDQITKWQVAKHIPLGSVWAPFPSLSRYFTLTHVSNTGAAFGLFPEYGSIILAVAVVVITGIIIFSQQLTQGQRLVTLSLGLQLGGAVGNLIDRLRIGHVVDFMDFKIWPVWNVADASIVVGVCLLLWTLFRAPEQLGPLSPTADLEAPSD
jgi:signal peptidase II